jgi:hypothetical protein
MVEPKILDQPGWVKVIRLCLVCNLFVKGFFFFLSKGVFGKHPLGIYFDNFFTKKKNEFLPNKANTHTHIYMEKKSLKLFEH